jgi:hypothetical protein
MKFKIICQNLGITDYEITEKNKEASYDLLPVLEKKTQRVLNIGLLAVGQKPVQAIHLKIQIKINPLVTFLGN